MYLLFNWDSNREALHSRGFLKKAQINTTVRWRCEHAAIKVSAKKSLYLPSDASQILSTLLFFLSLILNPFYYYFFPCKHQGGCLVLILLEAIIHKGGVHFIWVAFYIQTMIKMHRIALAWAAQTLKKLFLVHSDSAACWPSPRRKTRWVAAAWTTFSLVALRSSPCRRVGQVNIFPLTAH